jgi:hypothetical protein
MGRREDNIKTRCMARGSGVGQLAHNTVHWRALVNPAKNIRVP